MQNTGRLEMITGCMFSGKSGEVIRRIERTQRISTRSKIQVFNSRLDERYDTAKVVTHSGGKMKAETADKADAVRRLVKKETEVVVIDEVQFFDDAIVDVIEGLVRDGRRVIAAGLDLDFRGEPFGPMPQLLARADKVEKLTAICTVCKAPATRTQRLVDGQAATYDEPIVVVGAADKYEARCLRHHEVRMDDSQRELAFG
ncbi:thymidine kinase [Patescibacteria group bacterium]